MSSSSSNCSIQSLANLVGQSQRNLVYLTIYCALVCFAVGAYLYSSWNIVGLLTTFGLLIYGHKEFLNLEYLSVNPLLQFAASIFRDTAAAFNVKLSLLIFLAYITVTKAQDIMERAHPRDLDYAKHAFSLFTFAFILTIVLRKACAKPRKKKLKFKLRHRKMKLPDCYLVETELFLSQS